MRLFRSSFSSSNFFIKTSVSAFCLLVFLAIVCVCAFAPEAYAAFPPDTKYTSENDIPDASPERQEYNNMTKESGFSAGKEAAFYTASFGLLAVRGTDWLMGLRLQGFFRKHWGLGFEMSSYDVQEKNEALFNTAGFVGIDLLYRTPLAPGFFVNAGIGILNHFQLYNYYGYNYYNNDYGWKGAAIHRIEWGYGARTGLEFFFPKATDDTISSLSLDFKYNSRSTEYGKGSMLSIQFGLNVWVGAWK